MATTKAERRLAVRTLSADAEGIVDGLDRHMLAGACNFPSLNALANGLDRLVICGALDRLDSRAGTGMIGRYRITGKPYRPMSVDFYSQRDVKRAPDVRERDVPLEDTRSLTGRILGDPRPGMSALDRKRISAAAKGEPWIKPDHISVVAATLAPDLGDEMEEASP